MQRPDQQNRIFVDISRIQQGLTIKRRHSQVVRQRSAKPLFPGSNPGVASNKKGTFVYQKFLFCLSKPQAWHIISPCGAGYHHGNAVYLITRQRASYLRLDDIQCSALMIYRNKLRMICKAYALIYL